MPEAYLCDALRTPFGRYGGVLAAVRPDDLAAVPIRALRDRLTRLDWEQVDDVIFGCANQAGEDNRNVARMAVLLAGLPEAVPGTTVNRLCGSSLDAVAVAARAVKSGEVNLVLAGGVESMSRAPFVLPKAETAFGRRAEIFDTTIGWRFINPRLEKLYGTDTMPQTAENVAEQFGVSRAAQDGFACRSQARYEAARARGFFAAEIVPVEVPGKKGQMVTVANDEQPRSDTTVEGLARLRPIVGSDGTVTAGNSSGVNDGAALVVVASEEAVRTHGLTPRARVLGSAMAGIAPRIMGYAPVPATQKLLARLNRTLEDFDLVELNEAFAAQALAVTRALGLPDDSEKVNPNGGAIAVGHPLGASGARLVATALNQLDQPGGARRVVCTMCIGVGQGVAVAFEKA